MMLSVVVALSMVKSVNQSLVVLEKANNDMLEQISELKEEQKEIKDLISNIEVIELTKVRFTHYYVGDELNSTNQTSTGFKTTDFEINDLGIYTYDGRIVLATANNNYKIETLPNGYKAYDYYDELNVVIDKVSYPAIVLDLCGACYWSEDIQRYDLFVSNENIKIDQKGYIYPEGEMQ